MRFRPLRRKNVSSPNIKHNIFKTMRRSAAHFSARLGVDIRLLRLCPLRELAVAKEIDLRGRAREIFSWAGPSEIMNRWRLGFSELLSFSKPHSVPELLGVSGDRMHSIAFRRGVAAHDCRAAPPKHKTTTTNGKKP